MKLDTYNRARLEILNYIIQFTTVKNHGNKKDGCDYFLHSTECAWLGGSFSDHKAPIGSLCMLSSAPNTKYYLSWLLEYKEESGGNYLMQSIEDHGLSWWTNVSVYYLPKTESDKYPRWKWSDEQFAFEDRWTKSCKKRDPYITLQRPAIFDEKGGVTLGTRTRFGWDDYRPEKYFPNWKKVTMKQMLEFYDECVNNKPKKEPQT